MSSLLVVSAERPKKKKELALGMNCVRVPIKREEEAISQRRERRGELLNDRDLKGPADM